MHNHVVLDGDSQFRDAAKDAMEKGPWRYPYTAQAPLKEALSPACL